MNLHMIYMTLSLVRYNNGNLEVIGAGMPPALLCKVSTSEVIELSAKGIPLGAPASYPYVHHKLEVQPGDVLFIATDGLMEGFSQDREMMGTDRIKEKFAASCSESANGIIQNLMQAFEEWTEGAELQDDITMMVIKFK